MKKTLLSTMAIAALIGSTTVYAQPLEKNIQVEAEVHSIVSMNKADGSPLDKIKLNYDAAKNDGTYTHSENIEIKATNTDKVRVRLSDVFILKNGKNKFFDHVITLGEEEIYSGSVDGTRQYFLGKGTSFDLTNGHATVLPLVISAKQPKNSAVGIYSGVAKLVIEEDI